MLKMYDIDSVKWDIIRKTAMEKAIWKRIYEY